MKYITGFFAFWYDFIVGDAWEVAAGVVVALVVLGVAVHSLGVDPTAAALLLPVIVVVLLGYSLWRARASA